MSVTVNVFINFKGSQEKLLKILADDFLILVNQKKYWFLGFIEIGLCPRQHAPDYFTGRQFQPYNFVLTGSTYAGSPSLDTARDAHTIIMDTLAQMLALRLKTRTMSYCGEDGGPAPVSLHSPNEEERVHGASGREDPQAAKGLLPVIRKRKAATPAACPSRSPCRAAKSAK